MQSIPPASNGRATPNAGQRTRPVRSHLSALLPFVAPGLLVVVAVQQIVLSSTANLSPWTGGGFGMFSSIDTITARIVRTVLVVEGREVPVRLAPSDPLEQALLQARALPTQTRLDELATVLARQAWRIDPDFRVATPVYGNSPGRESPARPSAVRVEIYRILFDPVSQHVERVLLADATGMVP